MSSLSPTIFQGIVLVILRPWNGQSHPESLHLHSMRMNHDNIDEIFLFRLHCAGDVISAISY
eukprot:scaffold197_cov268-Chaetoceros_neogracile.AAC.41